MNFPCLQQRLKYSNNFFQKSNCIYDETNLNFSSVFISSEIVQVKMINTSTDEQISSENTMPGRRVLWINGRFPYGYAASLNLGSLT